MDNKNIQQTTISINNDLTPILNMLNSVNNFNISPLEFSKLVNDNEMLLNLFYCFSVYHTAFQYTNNYISSYKLSTFIAAFFLYEYCLPVTISPSFNAKNNIYNHVSKYNVHWKNGNK